MYTFKELQKACNKSVEGEERRLAILGNCATQFFSAAVQGYGRLSGMNLQVFDAGYHQILVQVFDPLSETYAFCPDYILLWFATEVLYEEFLSLEREKRLTFAEDYLDKIETCWSQVEKNTKARILQPNFVEVSDMGLGQYSGKVAETFIFQLRKLNYLLQESMAKHGNVYPVDFQRIQSERGRETYYSAVWYYHARMTVCMDALPDVGKAVVDVLSAIEGKIKKCVVLDLDNTLWGGVIGDDGLGGIQIGELKKGRVYTQFQRWLKQLKEFGILLAVCSKNEEEIAKEPFEKHGEMVLKLSDISLFVANWQDKATNIRRIQEILNIGMESLVFLDDNPFERNLVREKIPEITVPELPEDPALWLDYLQKGNYFETASFTGDGADRTQQYQTEFQRRKGEWEFDSIEDYLKSLGMAGKIKPFEPSRYARIAQLTQRSNQFNLRTIRYTEEEIRRIAKDPDYLAFYGTLADQFGDYGLVSVVILKRISPEELFIDTWLMSCRVLKRGMEEYVLNQLVQIAKSHGFKKVSAEYIPTAKNRMVQDLYRDMGFAKTSDNHYEVLIDGYQEKPTWIKEEPEDGQKRGMGKSQ